MNTNAPGCQRRGPSQRLVAQLQLQPEVEEMGAKKNAFEIIAAVIICVKTFILSRCRLSLYIYFDQSTAAISG
jgi:hypothetical protein